MDRNKRTILPNLRNGKGNTNWARCVNYVYVWPEMLFACIEPTAMTPFGPTDRPIDQLLFDAVQAYSMRLRGQRAQRVTMDFPDGTSFAMQLPGEEPRYPLSVIEPAIWPPDEGWAFRPGEAALSGYRFKLKGIPLAILEELARASGAPVTVDKLKRAAWHDEPEDVEDGALQSHISFLRRKIRDLLEMERGIDPIPNVGGAYKLVIH